jgi:membrane-bound lytic murein transglycosylase B
MLLAVACAAPFASPAPLAGARAEDDRPPFQEWLAELRAEALARGIRQDVVTLALDGLVEPVPIILERDRTQAEFSLDLDAYLKRRVDAVTVRAARRASTRHRALLRRVRAAYGVDASTIVAVWGLESNFGRFSGVRPTVAALATLAYDPRRAAFFREELFHALTILDRGDIEHARMKGSWAGAMGQPQFMPSSYVRFAVDFDRDGRKDIWTSPPDIFASIANYLKAHGWRTGERWGRRVRVSEEALARVADRVAFRTEGCRAVRELTDPLPVDEWQRLGVRLASGQRLPSSRQPASLLRVSGHTYLVYRNYEAVLGYNCAHAYALSVAQLSDRIAGR